MAIYYDPTETANSQVWDKEFRRIQAIPMTHLERWTGADVAIIPGERVPPVKGRLREEVKKGILIQRKEKSDLLNSIPRLSEILQRMNDCESISYLATVGRFTNDDGKVAVDGYPSGWDFASYLGAINAWQLRGGNIMQFDTPGALADWYNHMALYVEAGKLNRTLAVSKATQKLSGGIYDPKPWRVVLMGIEGLGPKRGSDIADQFGTLAEALMWLSHPEDSDIKIKGVGPGTVSKVRSQLGLEDGQWFMIEGLSPTMNGGAT